jgi:hypothetical protein
MSSPAFGLLIAYAAFQLLWPARASLYPGNVLWTEEAQNFSWRMMLRDKQGEMKLRVETSSGTDTLSSDRFLRIWQRNVVAKRPFLTLQFAHFIANYYRQQGHTNVRVYADSWMSLNGRERQPLIDPVVDLASVRQSPWPANWIVPLHEAKGEVATSGGGS